VGFAECLENVTLKIKVFPLKSIAVQGITISDNGGKTMAKEVRGKPIFTIPPQSLLSGELCKLRQSRRLLIKDESIKQNEAQQERVKQRLRAIGREDLCQ
jgi:hypothetical protein